MPKFKLNQFNIPEVLLLLLYVGIFLPSSISQLADSEFWEIDPRSIMSALDGLTTYPFYNMNSQYHSQYYGWTFFSINFAAISLLKLCGVASEAAINSVVKIIHFIIGGFVVMASYRLSARFLPPVVSAIAVFLFMIDPVFSHYVITLHPEMMGILFQILGIRFLCLVWNQSQFDWYKFAIAMAMLCLSAWSKQPFVICSFFIILGFMLASVQIKGQRVFLIKNILPISLTLLLIAVATLFVVHPYAFLEPQRFIQAQKDLLASQASPFSVSVALEWLLKVSSAPIVPLSILLSATVLPSRKVPFAFKLSVVFTLVCAAMFINGQRVFVTPTYLFPVYGFMYFNIIYYIYWISKKISKRRLGAMERLLIGLSTISIGLVAISNFIFTITIAQTKYLFGDRSTINQAWNYLASLPVGTRVAFSPNIAILEPLKGSSCSAWQGCGTVKDLSAYDPQVVVFSPSRYYDYSAYKQFVSSHRYSLVRQITSDSSDRLKSDSSDRSECSTAGELLVVQHLADFVPALYQAYSNSIVSCLTEYSDALRSYRTGSVSTGPDVFIYQRAFGI
jgi:hypothetical protein